jgi:hypothetical protein
MTGTLEPRPLNPYASQPDRAFWKRSVANRHATEINELFRGIVGLENSKFATAGSCFAQHLGKALKARGLLYLDYEPPPPFLTSRPRADDPLPPFATDGDIGQFGYGLFSCRYGNIYSVRQLKQLLEEAFGVRQPVEFIWMKSDRYYDALRPSIEPEGFNSREQVIALRKSHLSRVRALFTDLDVLVLTLGLTETWVSTKDGTAYPIAPGVIAGEFNVSDYQLKNFRYNEIYDDMAAFITALRAVNPSAKLLLTVSPVPLAATATDQHVLVATTYSKSVLRSVAGDLAEDIEGVDYFPSFEIITGQPSRHMYYNPDLRTVRQAGVAEVMRHFFGDHAEHQAPKTTDIAPVTDDPRSIAGFEHCDESRLESAK